MQYNMFSRKGDEFVLQVLQSNFHYSHELFAIVVQPIPNINYA